MTSKTTFLRAACALGTLSFVLALPASTNFAAQSRSIEEKYPGALTQVRRLSGQSVVPVFDGWEATRRLKMAPETKSIPVIALTAHAMTGDREKCIAAGCDDFDTKPVEISRLLGKIATLLQKQPSP